MSLQGRRKDQLPGGQSTALSLPGMASFFSAYIFKAENVPQIVRNSSFLFQLSPTAALLPHPSADGHPRFYIA